MAAAPEPTWADGPYELIKPPASYRDEKAHHAVGVATEMAFVHNCFLRGFNAIVLQGPGLPSKGQPGYNPRDVKDFLHFAEILLNVLQHHHDIEERLAFPAIEAGINKPGWFYAAVDQHAAFHDGLNALKVYVVQTQTKPDDWRWADMHKIIDALMSPLVQHLTEEVDFLLALDEFDEEKVKAAWDKSVEDGQKEVVGLAGLYDIMPLMFTCHDRSFEDGEKFPPVSSLIRHAVEIYFKRRHRGAWRFAPCDISGKPKALPFLKKTEPEPAEGIAIAM